MKGITKIETNNFKIIITVVILHYVTAIHKPL